jgi:hypothetical protein
MYTRALAVLAGVMAVAILSGCSREKLDWKSAEAADTVEAYDHFLARHPEGDLAAQARARVAQLNEDQDWKRATTTDSEQAYRQFLAQHESGKWAEEARIRIENFALDGTASGPTHPTMDAEPAAGSAVAAATPPPVAPPVSASAPAAAATPPPSAGPTATAPPRAGDTASPSPPTTPPRVAGASPSAPITESSVPTVPAAPVPATTTPGQFGIQLGAFRTQEAALNDWKRLQVKFDTDLHGLFARAVPVTHSAGQLFRLQAPVGEESRARAICASLMKQSQPCVIVLPHTQ